MKVIHIVLQFISPSQLPCDSYLGSIIMPLSQLRTLRFSEVTQLRFELRSTDSKPNISTH